jgi:hypothetical protein
MLESADQPQGSEVAGARDFHVEPFTLETRMRSCSSGRVRGDDPELASYLRIEERELEGVGALN